jgi:predicted nucleotidyltransferase
MATYKISFEQIRQQPGLDEMLQALERGLEKFQIDYYLVGAVSRDVWMSGIHKLKPRRTTGDIDFAIFINDKGAYEKLKDYLVKEEGFNSYHENAFVLIWKDGFQVDLLPFGAIEDENRKVTVLGTGYTSVHVDGFKEVYEEGLPEVNLAGKHQFKFCTLPGIVLLKLIAWDDRPEARRDDILDISELLDNFFDMYQDKIWEEHNDLFKDEDGELIHVAAVVIGREIRKIALRNDKLFQRIANLLKRNSGNPESSPMGVIMSKYFDNTIEESVQLIRKMESGFLAIN